MAYSINDRDRGNRWWPQEVSAGTGRVPALVTLPIHDGCRLRLRWPGCLTKTDGQSRRHPFIGKTNTTGEFMNHHSRHEASRANPALEPFRVLIGSWNTTGTH